MCVGKSANNDESLVRSHLRRTASGKGFIEPNDMFSKTTNLNDKANEVKEFTDE